MTTVFCPELFVGTDQRANPTLLPLNFKYPNGFLSPPLLETKLRYCILMSISHPHFLSGNTSPKCNTFSQKLNLLK